MAQLTQLEILQNRRATAVANKTIHENIAILNADADQKALDLIDAQIAKLNQPEDAKA